MHGPKGVAEAAEAAADAAELRTENVSTIRVGVSRAHAADALHQELTEGLWLWRQRLGGHGWSRLAIRWRRVQATAIHHLGRRPHLLLLGGCVARGRTVQAIAGRRLVVAGCRPLQTATLLLLQAPATLLGFGADGRLVVGPVRCHAADGVAEAHPFGRRPTVSKRSVSPF